MMLALTLLFLAACGNSPRSAVKAFYDAVEEGRVEDALKMVSSQVTSSIGIDKTRAALQSATREIHDKGGLKSLDIVKEDVVGEVAEVEVRIHYGNGTEETEKVKVVKENGEWKIQPDK